MVLRISGARLGQEQPHRHGLQLPKLSTRIYVARDCDRLVSSPHTQARTENFGNIECVVSGMSHPSPGDDLCLRYQWPWLRWFLVPPGY